MKFLLTRFFSLFLFTGVMFSSNNVAISLPMESYIVIFTCSSADNENVILTDGSNSANFDESDCGANPESCDVIGAFMSRDIEEDMCVEQAAIM